MGTHETIQGQTELGSEDLVAGSAPALLLWGSRYGLLGVGGGGGEMLPFFLQTVGFYDAHIP